MTLKGYDILSTLIPGFLVLFVFKETFEYRYDKDLIVGYAVCAFIVGYFLNALSGWLEPIYFWTMRGKPSNRLLDGHSDWKVKFYESERAKKFLVKESGKPDATNEELFAIAMRNVHGTKDTRIDDFNSMYAFSPVVLTSALLSTGLLAKQYYFDWRFYLIAMAFIIASWVRFRERGYYFAREILNEYLKQKTKKPARTEL